jgi:UDP-N-acetylglucosamine 2-epimerase (non-hydrolysing)
VIDSLLWTVEKLEKGYRNDKIIQFEKDINFSKKIILVTGHRRESFDGGFEELCKSLSKLANREDVQIIFPVHLNPKVKKVVFESLKNVKNIYLSEPLEYPVFIWLMNKANLIISDSGGIQEEAPSLKKPVLVTREVTERKEGVAKGFSILTGMNDKKIYNEAIKVLEFGFENNNENPFGVGNASSSIVEILKRTLR